MTLQLALHHLHFDKADAPRVSVNPVGALLGAVLGLLGGVLASLTGTLLLACAWLTHDALCDRVGSFVLCLTIPLLLAGAACLDGTTDKQRSSDV